MSDWLRDFHFIEPLWLLALLPLALLLWSVWRDEGASSAWRRVVDPHLLAVLRVGGGARARRLPLLLLAVGWTIAVLALANPTVERKPVPAFRSDAARVVVLDLSRSMLAEDLTPSRLERARYKVADILTRSADGQVGLVAFAGDAFSVSPLTDDADTIRDMLEALSPQVMPMQGSRPDLGIALGRELLQQAGAHAGEVILLTDDAGGMRAQAAAESLREAGYRLGVIGVGTRDGAPVPGVTRSNGPVISQLPVAELEKLAGIGGGAYATLQSTDADLDQVLRDPGRQRLALSQESPMLAERWYELGPWIVLALVPLAALAFRRGWLVMMALALGPAAFIAPESALALGWDDLWQRADQQAAQALEAGDPERARALAKTPARAGSAAYRLGDYQDAAAQFAAGDQAVDHYNRGNALARSGALEEAIAAYDAALARDPAFADARYNRDQVASALQQQAQRQQPQSGQAEDADGGEGEREQAGADEGAQGGQDGGQSESQAPGQPGSPHSASEQAGEPQQGQLPSEDQAASQHGAGEDPSAAEGSTPQGASAAGAPAGSQEGSSASNNADQATGENRSRAAAQSGQQDAGADSPPQHAGAAPGDERTDNGAAGGAEDARAPDGASAAGSGVAETAAADYRQEAATAAAAAGQGGDDEAPAQGAGTDGRLAGHGLVETPEEREARQAADQWLRRIPDDPAELLRRKFLYQYRLRRDDPEALASGEPW